jgi:hypothetical protein
LALTSSLFLKLYSGGLQVEPAPVLQITHV